MYVGKFLPSLRVTKLVGDIKLEFFIKYALIRNMNILYIEDDAEIAEIYYIYLHTTFPNVDITLLLDGQEAIEELQKNPDKYSLVISDFNLPKKTGAEIFKFVNGEMFGIPFVLISGYDCTNDENLKFFFHSHVRNAFILKPCQPTEFIAKVKWCLETEKDVTKIYSQAATNIDERIPVNCSVFLKINSIPCDVYVKLSEDKFVKIINSNEVFSTEIILRLLSKGVTHFYVFKSELSRYGETIAHSLYLTLKRKAKRMSDTEKSQLTGKALSIIRNNLLQCGFNKSILSATEEVVNLQVDMIKRDPELSKFVEKFQLFRRMNTEHSRLVSFLCVGILYDVGWNSESTVHNMCMASLFHDISLPEDFNQRMMEAGGIQNLPESDQHLYSIHAEESADIAKNFVSIAPGMQQIILEHHELPDGSGFPRKLTSQVIQPLSAVLHMSDVAAESIWRHNFSFSEVHAEFLKNKLFYSSGYYRKPYDALMKVLKR